MNYNFVDKAIIWGIIGLIILVSVSAALLLSYGCHNYLGPLVVGSNDPVAVAVFCKGT